MTTQHEKDWALLNAFADGELDKDEATIIEARLAVDADLRNDLQRIRELKLQLASFRPVESDVEFADEPEVKRGWYRRAIAAAAAIIAIAVFLAAYAWYPQVRGFEGIAIAAHEQFSRSTYIVEERHVAKVVSTGNAFEFKAPDLTDSRLFLVDVQNTIVDHNDSINLHYRGLRGCRLTLVALAGGLPTDVPAPAGRLMHVWSYGGYSFAILATGMDPERFDSVAKFAQATIRNDMRNQRDLRIAMAEKYRTARPCV